MKKRWWLVLAALLLAVIAFFVVLVYGFPERFFVSGSVNTIASVELERRDRTFLLTEKDDIQEFYDALRDTTRFRCVWIADGDSLTSDPKYTLTVTYTNGKSVYIKTSEVGSFIYKYIDPQAKKGDHSYICAYNETLYEWAKSMV